MIWKFKYADTVISEEQNIGDDVATMLSAAHHPGWNAPIEYVNNELCYIYSNDTIDGLELVAENVDFGGMV